MSKDPNQHNKAKENIKEDLKNIKDNVKENVADMKHKVKDNINDIKANAKENLNNVKDNIKSEIKKPKIEVRPVPSRFSPGLLGLAALVIGGSLYFWNTTNQKKVTVAVPSGTTVKTTTV